MVGFESMHTILSFSILPISLQALSLTKARIAALIELMEPSLFVS